MGQLTVKINFEPCFDSGKKRGATVRLSNVTVNAPSVLKHEEELESLAAIMPADVDERRKWVQVGIDINLTAITLTHKLQTMKTVEEHLYQKRT